MAPRKISRMSTAALINDVNSPTTARRAADDRELPEVAVARYSRAVASSSLRAAAAARHSSGSAVRRSNHPRARSEEHTSELQSLAYLVCRLLLEKKKRTRNLQIREVG